MRKIRKTKDDGRRFRDWLGEKGYETCSRDYPAAVAAESLVDDYLEEHEIDDEARMLRIRLLAARVGFVSDFDSVMGDDALSADD